MYSIDFMSCSALDLLQRSIVCHPSLFADAMRDVAKTHRNYVDVTTNKRARKIAEQMAMDCTAAAALIEEEKPEAILALGMGAYIPALQVAARLQCCPQACLADIATRVEG